jgi:parvulin-like peptidyl-prolyl isomerase
MIARKNQRPARIAWRRIAIVGGCLAGIVAAGLGIRAALLPHVTAQTPALEAPAPAPAPTPAPTGPSDYSSRVVAYIHETEPVTREELGEYLIARFGADRLELLINKRLIDDACRQAGIEVSGAEIEVALADDLHGLALDRNSFVNSLLARYGKTLFEWKEDVLRPKLQLSKLCRSRIRVTEEDLRKAFEATYGEKVEGQVILWENKPSGVEQAIAEYGKIRSSAEAFDQKAKSQYRSDLAATGGKTKPFGRYTMGDEEFDRHVFRLQPGEISEVIRSIEGPIVFKCHRRYPADTSVSLETVREKLLKEVVDRVVTREMGKAFEMLRVQAQPQLLLKKKNKVEDPDGPAETAGVPRCQQVVATFVNASPVTREDLGEFLIARYGTEKLEFLVNRRIIDRACTARGVTVTAQEIEDALAQDLHKLNTDLKDFEGKFLKPYKKNLYEWREDVIRPRLLLTKLCRDRVHVMEDEVKLAYNAHYGEKLHCQMIMWPLDQTKFALAEYTRIRDNPEAFDEKAKQQASTTLAAKGGWVDPFGRHTLGDEDVEREAFKLQPGEMTTLIGTPQGNVVVKLHKRIPPDTSVSLESVREPLTKEVYEKKVQIEMQTAFRDLRQDANPRLMLKDGKPVNLTEETKKLLTQTPDGTPRPDDIQIREIKPAAH